VRKNLFTLTAIRQLEKQHPQTNCRQLLPFSTHETILKQSRLNFKWPSTSNTVV
jgi:hypothetical protein